MIYLILAALRERILCCWRMRARAFIALGSRLFVILAGFICLLLFKSSDLGRAIQSYGTLGVDLQDAASRGF
jgi:hypothetical protein